MSILSKVKAKAKSAISKAKSVVKSIGNTVKTAFSSTKSIASNAKASTLSAFGQNQLPRQPASSALADAKGGSRKVEQQIVDYYRATGSLRDAKGSSANSYGGYTPVPTTLSGGQRSANRSTIPGLTTPTTITSRQGITKSDMGISSESLASAPSISLPSAPSYTDVGQINNAGLIGALSETQSYDSESGLFVPNTTTEDPQTTEEARRKKDFEDLMGMMPEKESVYDDREVKKQQAEVRRRQQEVNNYTAQLNSVVAKQNADLLTLRGIGSKEGVTETVYGGQAATINREAAIKALPIQAQIAAAQGNLELAQDYLSELITVKKDQIEADFSYNMAKFSAIKDYLSGEQKIRLDEITKTEERAYNQTQKNLDLQDEWAKYAIQNGQGYLVSRIHGLNAGSSTFREDLGKIVGNIQDLDAIKKMSEDNRIELSAEDRRILAGGGFSATEIDAIASDVSEYGINAVLEGLTDKRQKDAIMKVYGGGEDNTQFLTRDYFESLFTKDQLEEAAAKAGFTGGGFLGAGVGKSGIADYLDSIEKTIAAYRTAGYTDKEILEMMQ